MILHVLHAVLVVSLVLSFPFTMAALVVKFDDGGVLHRDDPDRD